MTRVYPEYYYATYCLKSFSAEVNRTLASQKFLIQQELNYSELFWAVCLNLHLVIVTPVEQSKISISYPPESYIASYMAWIIMALILLYVTVKGKHGLALDLHVKVSLHCCYPGRLATQSSPNSLASEALVGSTESRSFQYCYHPFYGLYRPSRVSCWGLCSASLL